MIINNLSLILLTALTVATTPTLGQDGALQACEEDSISRSQLKSPVTFKFDWPFIPLYMYDIKGINYQVSIGKPLKWPHYSQHFTIGLGYLQWGTSSATIPGRGDNFFHYICSTVEYRRSWHFLQYRGFNYSGYLSAGGGVGNIGWRTGYTNPANNRQIWTTVNGESYVGIMAAGIGTETGGLEVRSYYWQKPDRLYYSIGLNLDFSKREAFPRIIMVQFGIITGLLSLLRLLAL